MFMSETNLVYHKYLQTAILSHALYHEHKHNFLLFINYSNKLNQQVLTCKQVLYMYNKFHHYQSSYIKILLFTNRSQHVFWKKANVLCNGILTNFKLFFFITLIYGQNAPFVYCFHNKLLLHKKSLFDFFLFYVCRQYTIIASIYIAEHIFRSKFRKCQNHILSHSESFNFVIQIWHVG